MYDLLRKPRNWLSWGNKLTVLKTVGSMSSLKIRLRSKTGKPLLTIFSEIWEENEFVFFDTRTTPTNWCSQTEFLSGRQKMDQTDSLAGYGFLVWKSLMSFSSVFCCVYLSSLRGRFFTPSKCLLKGLFTFSTASTFIKPWWNGWARSRKWTQVEIA